MMDILQESPKMGIIKSLPGINWNPRYFVKKDISDKYQLVIVVVGFNRVTIWYVNLPLSTVEFSKEFSGCDVTSSINFFSGYDQVDLDKEYRDLTGFITPFRLMMMTTLPQGPINLVAKFVRIVTKIQADYFQDPAKQFLDNLG